MKTKINSRNSDLTKKVFLVLGGLALFATASFAQVTVSGSTGANAVYPSLTQAGGAFAAINGAGSQAGNNILITITADVATEDGATSLNNGGWTTLTVNPSGARTISGAPVAGTPLINLNGASNVTINGLNASGNSLTISNTTIGTTAGTSTIRFIADASNNTVTNCTILGSSTSTLGTAAGTIVFSTGTTTGNDNNTISNNNIGPAGVNLPSKAIMASGTSSAIENDNAVITGNNIFDYFIPTTTHSAINIVTGNEAWTVSSNKFYQTAARTVTTAAVRHSVITLNNSTGGFTISGNTIGFAAANGTGTYTISGTSNEFRAIDASSVRTTAPATSIQGNTITAINQTSSRASTTTANSCFIAVAMGTTDGLINAGDSAGNTIGSLDGSTTIVINETSVTASTAPVLGFYNFSFQSTNISNNNIGSITIQSTGTVVGFRGMLVNTNTGLTATLNNNTIANITDTQVGNYGMFGIQSALPNTTAIGNTIRNFNGNSTFASNIVSSGILLSGSTGVNTISQNTIHSLFNASGASNAAMYAMSCSFPATANIVERNLIHSLSMTSSVTTGQIVGIIASPAASTATYKNNMVRLGIDAAGASVTLGCFHAGLWDNSGTNNFYHNSVYIGGSGVVSAAANYAFFSQVTTNVRNYQDNIFWNARSNASGTGKNYAIAVAGTAPNPAGLTSNFNDLYATGTGSFVGLFNAIDQTTIGDWRTATGQDAQSLSADPQFINAIGTATRPIHETKSKTVPLAVVDLHIHPSNPTPIEGAGLAIAGVTNDFDGQARAGLTPTDIGADAGNFVAQDISAPAISYALLSNTASTANRPFNNVTATDATGVNIAPGTRPRVYYKKSTDGVNNFNDNTPGTPGWKFAEANGGGGSPFNFIIDYSLLFGGAGASAGDTIQYFVVAQDTVVPIPNVGINSGTFAATPTSVALAGAFPITGSINSYNIVATISGTKNIGTGGGSHYATLTAAIADLNAKILDGSLTLVLNDPNYPTETFPIIINANPGSSGSNTVTIRPATGVSPTLTGSSASAMIVINGADYVTIDGNNGGTMFPTPNVPTRDLVIINTNLSTSSAVVWLQTTGGADAATNNTVKNCTLTGNSNTTTLFGVGSGSSTISITSTGTGNNTNTFQNNSISKTQYGIYSGGASAANKNTANVIELNAINTASPNNVAIGGILVNFEDGIVIAQNNIAHISSATTPAFGITLGTRPANIFTGFTGNEVTGASVFGNLIDDIVRAGDGTALGIAVAPVTTVGASGNVIGNNMISGVRTTIATPSDFAAGILLTGGATSFTEVYYNSVSMTGVGSNSSPTFGIVVGGASTNPSVILRNNIFLNTQTTTTGKTYAIGLTYGSPYTNLTSDYNDFFSSGATANFAVTGGLTGTDRTSLAAWRTETGKDANSVSGDPGFVGASDLHLLAFTSPAANAGTVVFVTNDFDGNQRSPTRPDIGADEIISVELLSLVLSAGGPLSPAFTSSNSGPYTLNVAHNVTSTTVTPTVIDSNTTVKVNNTSVTSGTPSAPIALAVGNTVITVVTHPQFGADKTYTVTVTRAPLPQVTTGSDSGAGSLRQIIADAVDGDVITFGSFRPGSTKGGAITIPFSLVTLTSAELLIDKNLVIDGGGASVTHITRDSGAPAFRIFHIVPGHTVTIMRMKISGGAATGAAGGAIFNDTSSLSVDRCAIINNSADTSGAIQNSGTLVMLGSLVADNNATAGDGGAMRNDGTMKITNSTISTNHAVPAGADGGGILNGLARTLSIGNCTFFKNTAGHDGGGINTAGTLTIRNSIIAYNTAGNAGPNLFKGAGTATSGGYNLVSDDGGGNITDTLPGGPIFSAAGDQRNTDPMLGLRGNNGGQTESYIPLVNSPAIDKGKDLDADGNPTSTDQRELSRPIDDPAVSNAPSPGDGSDIGAVELGIGSHPIDAASMKQHGPGGPVYPIVLPLGGLPGVECRSGGAPGVYQLLIRFATSITFTPGAAGAQVTNGAGSVTGVSRPEFINGPNGSGTNVTIDLTGVTNAQTLTVALLNVNGVADNDIGVRMGVLQGDVDGNRLTNSTDVSSVQFESGHTLTGPSAGNYRNDITASGEINSSDVSSAQFYSGTGLPLPY